MWSFFSFLVFTCCCKDWDRIVEQGTQKFDHASTVDRGLEVARELERAGELAVAADLEKICLQMPRDIKGLNLMRRLELIAELAELANTDRFVDGCNPSISFVDEIQCLAHNFELQNLSLLGGKTNQTIQGVQALLDLNLPTLRIAEGSLGSVVVELGRARV